MQGRQAGCLEIVLVHILDGRITHQAMAKTVAALEPAGLVRRDPDPADGDGHPSDLRVTKRNWSAFHGTDLDLRLRRRGGTQIVLTGISTSIGGGDHGRLPDAG